MTWLLTLAFDGTEYCGFQVQPNGRSVAAAFQDGLEAVIGRRPDIKGCSRTDAGVHARGQVASVHLPEGYTPQEIQNYLNRYLPEDVAVGGGGGEGGGVRGPAAAAGEGERRPHRRGDHRH